MTVGGTHPDLPFPPKWLQIADRLPPARERPDVPDADWAGYDQKGNVIYTKGDLLFRRKKSKEMVMDGFSELKPDPQQAPEWARRPFLIWKGESRVEDVM